MTVGAVVVSTLLVAVPAQAAPSSDEVEVSWDAVTATPGEVGTMAICSTPTRLTTQAIWYSCTVFSGEVIQAWMICTDNVEDYLYVSPYIGEGSWRIIGTCPPGQIREDEGIYYF